MNILAIAAHGFYENYSSSFVHNQLKAYVKLGHRVRVIVPAAAGKKTAQFGRISPLIVPVQQDGVEIYYLRYLSLGHFGENTFNPASAEFAVKMLKKRLLKGFKPDVIHAHAILFAGRLALALKRYTGAPLVITTHGGDTRLSAEPEQCDRAKKICDNAEKVVAVSEVCADIVKALGTSSQTMCILNGFESANVKQSTKRRFSLIQANALRPDKHTELSIEAVDVLKDKYPQITLDIVGDGTERSMLEKLVHERKLESFVRFHGRLPNPDTLALMSECEIFIMPSVREGFGIVYLEAMASRCLTVGTAGEGISCFIKNGENGFLVEAMDVRGIISAVEYCFENPDRAAAIAESGKRDALSLTWEKNAVEYLSVFNDIIETKNRRNNSE